MDEFEAIANEQVTEAFKDMAKIVQSMSQAEQDAYAERNPQRYWMQVQFSDSTFAISAN